MHLFQIVCPYRSDIFAMGSERLEGVAKFSGGVQKKKKIQPRAHLLEDSSRYKG